MNVFLNKTKQTFALIPWWFIEALELESGLFHDSVDEREAFFNNWYHKNSELGNEKSEANERGEQNTQNIQYY